MLTGQIGLYEEALVIGRDLPVTELTGSIQLNLGYAKRAVGPDEEGRHLYESAIRAFGQAQDHHGVARAAHNLNIALVKDEKFDAAIPALQQQRGCGT
jgi:tetratricopeptide (TPR) repeat protein